MADRKAEAGAARAPRLIDAVRQARIDIAERAGVVVDLRDAEIARLEILNEALDPVYAELPASIELFDRGITHGDPPRLWVDMVAFVAMGRDKRVYRFVQDTRFGRRVLAESADVGEMVEAVTRYLARRLVERERVIVGETELTARDILIDRSVRRARHWRVFGVFLLGLLAGAVLLLAAAWFGVGR
ncbi:MAG TPA: hypothetical protein VHN11_12860 [Xanthobacteraceae bacterium]|jgi:hypothetical protein|nr:hypothetical protein [Xanthobacteraceae bacterium]